MRRLVIAALVAGILSVMAAAIATAHEDHSTSQWPTTCVALNDVVETHLGNLGNVGIYQRTFGDQAEAACQNDHRNDVTAVFGWAIAAEPGASSADLELDWPTTCVELNDIVEGHLGNQGNVAIYQNTFGDQAEAACQNDHREDVRSVFAWAIGGATASASGPRLAVHELVQRSQAAVRYIGTPDSCGSGFVVTADGYVVTNSHVLDGARQIVVGTLDGEETDATVVADDPERDLALLKLPGGPHPFLAFGQSADLQVGEDLVILGYPLCLETLTVTRGILSARHTDWLQTDATANPGNSGGPGLNPQGGVIGVATAKLGGGAVEGVESANFLIDGDLVRSVVDNWIIRHRTGASPESSPVGSASSASNQPTSRDSPPSVQPDYARVRRVAIARGAPENQADDIAASVVQRGTVDAFLRGLDDGVQYGRYDCRWQSTQCPLARQKPDHPEFERVRQVAIARGASDRQADDVAVSVVQRGAVDAFLRGTDDGVQFGRYHCKWRSSQCPLAPLPPPSDIYGRGETVSDYRQIDSGRYVATIEWTVNGVYFSSIDHWSCSYFWADLYDVNGNRVQLVYRYSCEGSARQTFTVEGPTQIYVSVKGAHEDARWKVSFQRVN